MDAARQAVGLSARTDTLNNLSLALRLRYDRFRTKSDLGEAIRSGRQALAAMSAGETYEAAILTNLAMTLFRRYEDTGTLDDLDEAIDLGRRAVTHPADPASHARNLSNLTTSLRARFERTGVRADVDEAVNVIRQAIALTPAEHIDRAGHLSNLATALRDRYRHDPRQADLDEALDLLRDVARAPWAPTYMRVSTAWDWGGLAAEHSDHSDAVEGFGTAVDLLPVLTWHGFDRATREHHLAEWNGLACEAAAAALDANEPRRAVELLEAGHSVLWNSALRLRGDLTELEKAAPDKAQRLSEVRAVLDARNSDDDDRVRLAREWDAIIDEVRALKGFENFLAATPFAELSRAAEGGPVVVLNLSRRRCDAIVVTPGQVDVVPLPELTRQSAVDRTNALLSALAKANTGFLNRERARHAMRGTLEWLWDVVAGPVLNAVGSCTNLWWCPTGPLTLLPVHAAGRDSLSVHGKVISSYTSTLSALSRARARSATTPARALAVGLPETPGDFARLPAVETELQVLGQHLATDRLIGEKATRAAVREGLADHPWVHLSCHGGQNLTDPAQGAIFLWDGPLTVLDIAEQHVEHAELAYLSACRTALSGVRLLDEAVHVAGALQLVGYRHVVATMWSVFDEHAPAMADVVYGHLTAQGEPDADRAAAAVHAAVTRLREDWPDEPMVWAPYIHIGP